jgi:hypothetical protein
MNGFSVKIKVNAGFPSMGQKGYEVIDIFIAL